MLDWKERKSQPKNSQAEILELWNTVVEIEIHQLTVQLSKRDSETMAGSIIQVVEHLPSKRKALSSNPSTTQRKLARFWSLDSLPNPHPQKKKKNEGKNDTRKNSSLPEGTKTIGSSESSGKYERLIFFFFLISYF
jgi:hypothetical protein